MTSNSGTGALLSGLAGGYMSGKQMQRDMTQQQQPALGLPTTSATSATGLPQTQPQAPLPATPEAKAAVSQSTGAWSTLAGYLNQPAQKG